MSTSWKSQTALVSLTHAMMFLSLVLIGMSCGGQQATAPDTAAATDTPAAPAAPAALPSDGPFTLAALKYMPEQSHLALALPPMSGVLAKVLALDERLDVVNIAGELESIASDLAAQLGEYDAETLEEIMLAKGLDPAAPIALFVDADPAFARVSEGDQMDLSDLEMPALALAVGVSDAAKATATLEELTMMASTSETIEAAGVSINSLSIADDDYGYFFDGKSLVLGHLAMVKAAADRVAAPAAIRYGTAECPADSKDEAVLLLYGGRAVPLIKKILPAIPVEANMRPLLDSQILNLEQMLSGEDSDDPVVMSLAWTPEKLELKSRMDTVKHPAVLTVSGQAAALQYPQKLPDNSVALLSLLLTPEYKKQITDVYLKALPAEMTQNPGTAQALSMANQVLTMLGQEICLGLSGAEEDLPGLFLMVQLSNPEATRGLLQMLVPTMPGEKYRDLDIATIAAPIPVALSVAYPGDMMLLSTDEEQMKGIIDRVLDKSTSKLFASLKPPLDPAVPRYSALFVDESLYSGVVQPISMLTGGLPGEVGPIMDQIFNVASGLRMMNEMDGNWYVSKLTLLMKP